MNARPLSALPWKSVLKDRLALQQQLVDGLGEWIDDPASMPLVGMRWRGGDELAARRRLATAVRSVVEMPPIVWRHEIWALASNNSEAFVGTPAPVITPQWWTMESDVVVESATAVKLLGPGLWAMCGLVFVVYEMAAGSRRSLTETTMSDPLDVPRQCVMGVNIVQRVREDLSVAETKLMAMIMADVGLPIDEDVACEIYARRKFLTLPFVQEVREKALGRQERRRGGSDAEMRVVTLRRRSSHHAGTGTRTVEWQHQWQVDGHWRNQWYPSTQQHQTIWIDEFMKGPDDKPLLLRKPAVIQAVR